MKRNFNDYPPRPTAGCLSVPLFNQKKRSRLPLTSNPSEHEFYSSSDYSSGQSSASSTLSSDNAGISQVLGPTNSKPHVQNSQWNKPGYQNTRPNSNPAGRSYAPMPHPGKTGNMGPRTGKPSANTKQSIFPNSSGAFPNKTNTSQAYPRAELQSFYSQPHPSESFQHRDLQRPRPGQPNTPASRPHHSGWKFTPNSSISQFNEDDLDAFSADHFDKPQKQPVLQIKPAEDNSLRVLTTVVEGMKHWSQYRDRAAFLFEIFATLDSAVTTGSHGAKNFLLRDGKHAVQCVFYETDRELPRLIRGQVHRCVGNYDRGRNLLKCVSVRAATLSEQRNSAGSVKASDAVMREFVKTCREV